MSTRSTAHDLARAHPRVWVDLTGDSDAITALHAVGLLRDWAEAREAALVDKARLEGWTWPRIAEALQRSNESVRDKHGWASSAGSSDD